MIDTVLQPGKCNVTGSRKMRHVSPLLPIVHPAEHNVLKYGLHASVYQLEIQVGTPCT